MSAYLPVGPLISATGTTIIYLFVQVGNLWATWVLFFYNSPLIYQPVLLTVTPKGISSFLALLNPHHLHFNHANNILCLDSCNNY